MPKIAVYAIALNEILHAERWAKSAEGADYRIVADTGSTDGTQEKLREMGVTVHDISVRPWRFDVARNASLALIPADVDICVFVDMDEVIHKNFFQEVRKQWDPTADAGWITFDTGSKWQKDKIHTRNNWHWKYPIHEVAVYYGPNEPKYCTIKNAIISHKPDNNKSRGQYLPMLEMCVKEFPQDPRMWTYMVREYYFYRRWDDVVASAEKRMELGGWNVEEAATCRWAAEACHHQGKAEEATKWAERGAHILPNEGEPWFSVALDAYRNKRWQQCLDASIKAIECHRSVHYCYDSSVWDWKAYDLASISSWELGFIDEAITFANAASKANGEENDRILRNLKFFRQAKEKHGTRR